MDISGRFVTDCVAFVRIWEIATNSSVAANVRLACKAAAFCGGAARWGPILELLIRIYKAGVYFTGLQLLNTKRLPGLLYDARHHSRDRCFRLSFGQCLSPGSM